MCLSRPSVEILGVEKMSALISSSDIGAVRQAYMWAGIILLGGGRVSRFEILLTEIKRLIK